MALRGEQSTDSEVVNAMERFGGSFVRALAKLCYLADPDNLQRIKAAWPDYWQEYAEAARLAKERDRAKS
jgi:hypothetical protein